MESPGSVAGWLLPRAGLADASPCVCDTAAAAADPSPAGCSQQLIPVLLPPWGAAILLSQGWRGAEPSIGSCLWGGRAGGGRLCLQSAGPHWPPEESWSLVWLLAETPKKKNLCGRSGITQGLSCVTLARRVWGMMSGLPQFKVLWGQNWESLTGAQPLEPVRFRDSPGGAQPPEKGESPTDLKCYSPRNANWKGAAGVCGCWSEGGSVSPLYFHPGLCASSSLCFGLSLRQCIFEV